MHFHVSQGCHGLWKSLLDMFKIYHYLCSGVVKCLWKVVWKIEVENGIFLITFGGARYILLRLFGGG